jgi:hypothetical protein
VASRGLGAFDSSSPFVNAVYRIPYLMPGYQPAPGVLTCLPFYDAQMSNPGPDGKSTIAYCSLSRSTESVLVIGFAGLALYSLVALKGASKLLAVPAAGIALLHLFSG